MRSKYRIMAFASGERVFVMLFIYGSRHF
jgi:hypothetical protein